MSSLKTLRPIARRSSLILAYHGLIDGVPVGDPDNLLVRVDRFRAQVELLGDAGFGFVTVEEFARRAGGGPPPPGLVALSFDDGMADNHQLLLPLLQEYEITATIYVATGFVGEANPWLAPSSGARMMTAGELRDCLAAGVELGAHSHTHPDMLELDHATCLAEMRRSSDELVRLTGTAPRTFAYPFCHYGPQAVAAAADAGFEAAVTCRARGGWDRLTLKRTMITGRDGVLTFIGKVANLYEPLYFGPPGRAVRVLTRAPGQRIARARARNRHG
jgi:peptidoglycan/xylan/chitin deacetylase (PgdA/CDA1 family)